MKQTVVIPTFNRCRSLRHTLLRLAEQRLDDWEVIVVDNRSTDATRDLVGVLRRSFPVPLRYLHEPQPGPAAARNAGLRSALADHVLFLDDDIRVPDEYLSIARRRLQEWPDRWLVGPVVMPSSAHPLHRFVNSPVEPSDFYRPVEWYSSQLAQVNRSRLLELGGYDTRFSTAALEDSELSLRAAEEGIEIWMDPAWKASNMGWDSLDIETYSARATLHAASCGLLFERHGFSNRYDALFRRNVPLPGDSPALRLRKFAKGVLGLSAVQHVLHASCHALERAHPRSRVLQLLYKASVAGALSKGARAATRSLSGQRMSTLDTKLV